MTGLAPVRHTAFWAANETTRINTKATQAGIDRSLPNENPVAPSCDADET